MNAAQSVAVTPKWVRLLRWFLAIVFLAYGGVKLAGGQFYHGDFVIDSKTVDGTFFVWAFFGWSKPYSIFAGLGEFVPAILLLFPRTATLGAAMLFSVSLNITVMTFAFGFPSVKFFSLTYTILLGVLLAHDLPRLLPAFLPAVPPRQEPFGRFGRVMLSITGGVLLLIVAAALSESLTPPPDAAVRSRVVAMGVPEDSLHFVRSRYTGQLFGRAGEIEYRTLDSTRTFIAKVRRPHSFRPWRVESIEEKR